LIFHKVTHKNKLDPFFMAHDVDVYSVKTMNRVSNTRSTKLVIRWVGTSVKQLG